jgi:hypothetical protein
MKQLKPMRNIRQHQHNNAKLPLVSRFGNNTQLTAIHSIVVDSRSEPDRRTQQKIRGGFYYYIDQKNIILGLSAESRPIVSHRRFGHGGNQIAGTRLDLN